MNPRTSPLPLDDMLDRAYEEIIRLRARAARAPPTPSGSSVTEPDSDPDKDESGTVSFCVYCISLELTIVNSRRLGPTSQHLKLS